MDIIVTLLMAGDYIEKSLRELSSVQEISSELDLSSAYLNRLFKKILGITALDYLKMRKITCAIHSAARGRNNILDRALEYGFNSHEVFIRNCRRYFVKTPRELLSDREWQGQEPFTRESLAFKNLAGKLPVKKVRLPPVTLLENEEGPFTLYLPGGEFSGKKAGLKAGFPFTWKLLPGGVYDSCVTELKNITPGDIRQALLKEYPAARYIIEYRASEDTVWYYLPCEID